MSSKVLIFSDRAFPQKWRELCAACPDAKNDITFCRTPVIPKITADYDTAYVDLGKSEFNCPEFLLQLANSFNKLRVVGIAESPSGEEIARAAQMGVSEIVSHEKFFSRLETLFKRQEEKLPEESSVMTPEPYAPSSIIGHSPRIMEIKKTAAHLADVDYPNAIIFGETGSGKDLLAKVLHYSGVRKDKNFIEVNCSAIPDELFESELFGHKKGSFTDAKTDKAGLFEFANNGTIFLDEIGNLTLSAQAKLLKILESKKLRPLGAVEEKDINVRVIAATNINLEQAVAEQRFREDLLFRLNLIAIHLPPLRERKEDIPELAKYNFNFYRILYNRRDLSLNDGAIEILCDHNWPGNVRELRNVIERAVLLATSSEITAKDMAAAIKNGRITVRERRKITIEIPDQGITLKAIERQVIAEILNLVGWNRTQAAQLLGISRARLRRIMEENRLYEKRRSDE
jgi:DNA-binding NtrC family response regulator